MEISFLDLKTREVVNVYDGRKLGRVIDVVFENGSGKILGIVVPGDKKIFRRADDIFIPLEKIKRLGNDVILVGIQFDERYRRRSYDKTLSRNLKSYENYYSGLPSEVFYHPENEENFNQNLNSYQNPNLKNSRNYGTFIGQNASPAYNAMQNYQSYETPKSNYQNQNFFDDCKNNGNFCKNESTVNGQTCLKKKEKNSEKVRGSNGSFVHLRPVRSQKLNKPN